MTLYIKPLNKPKPPEKELPKVESKEPEKKTEPKKFRVSGFAYQFKTGAPTSLVAVNGIYSPRSEEEQAFLEHQVACSRILFS